MKRLKSYFVLGCIFGLGGCQDVVNKEPPSGYYSDAVNSSPDARITEVTGNGKPSADALIPLEDTSAWPVPPISTSLADATTFLETALASFDTSDISIIEDPTVPIDIISKGDYLGETNFVLEEVSTSPETASNVDSSTAPDVLQDSSVIMPEIYTEEASQEDSYSSEETYPETNVNFAETLENLVTDEEECYTIAKEELSAYLIESTENNGLEIYLMVGKYFGEDDCLIFYGESDETYPEICTYLYAYFFSDQPFGYLHCSGSEDLGVGKSLPDFCYYHGCFILKFR